MTKIRHRIGILGKPEKLFWALTEAEGLSGWWSTTASGMCAKGEKLQLGFGGVVTLKFIVESVHPTSSITIVCPDGPGSWRNSKLHFELMEDDNQTFLTLTHSSPIASEDDFLYFNTKWPVYLLSLRDLVEKGTGRPSPYDIPIFPGDNVTSNTE